MPKKRISLVVGLIVAFSPALAQNMGKLVYDSKCSACHAPDGSGNNTIGRSLKVPDIRPLVLSMSDDDLRRVIVVGKGKMPPIKKLDDEKIRQVMLFVRDLSSGNPKHGLAASQLLPDVAAVYRTRCSSCHAQDATGRTTMGKQLSVPDLTSAPASAHSDQEWEQAIRSGKGKMPAYGKDFTPVQLNQLLAYVRALAGKASTHAASATSALPQSPAPTSPSPARQPAPATQPASSKPAPATPQSATQSEPAPGTTGNQSAPLVRQLYSKKCAGCHARDGSGSGTIGKSLKVPDLRSPAVQSKSDQNLAAVVANGSGKMPGYKKKLSAQEIEELVAYIRQLGGSAH